MTKLPKTLLLALGLTSLLALSACGPENEFETAINEALSAGTNCWNISGQKAGTFPITVKRSLFSLGEINPILSGLQKQGLIDVEEVRVKYETADRISLTPAGEKANLWQEGSGICIGTPEVVEIVRYTYGGNGQNENAASVDITWQYGDTPRWLKRSAFAEIPGMSEPEEATIELQKASDGWHAEMFFF